MTNVCSGRRTAWLTNPATTGLLGLGIGLGWFSDRSATAAPLRPFTVSAESGPAVVLDQDGRRIAIPRAGRELLAGTTPTYVAFRLAGRSQLPEGVPTVAAGTGRDAVGPLRLDALALRTLDARLASADQVAVLGPRQTFLVESASSAGLADGTGSTQFWRAGVAAPSGGKSIGDTLAGWYESSADAVKKLNDQIAGTIKKTFSPAAPQAVIIPPAKVAAQVLSQEMRTLPLSQSISDSVQPAPVPEPSAWLIFAAATVLGLRLRPRKGT
ncbi:hypothetical protein [Paludisphaera mucosa]|uniref:PEP-CTERM protein-sorting domain-containing protein n=1 Tax=Paludisphaera mucosa TaxID=3030827 RepID=A0ABT6FDQ5_9BACT|nr:hypothetical protein [Paludisphaera mucosa]MDG3005518.1 hypothetical protein [Paludisphaera mucosa]